MRVRNISPSGALDVPGYGAVEYGGIIEVPDDGEPGSVFGGRPPEPRLADAMAALADATAAHDHPTAAALRCEITGWIDPDGTVHPGLDYGAGLLAQPDNWERVTITAPTPPAPTPPAPPAPTGGDDE